MVAGELVVDLDELFGFGVARRRSWFFSLKIIAMNGRMGFDWYFDYVALLNFFFEFVKIGGCVLSASLDRFYLLQMVLLQVTTHALLLIIIN